MKITATATKKATVATSLLICSDKCRNPETWVKLEPGAELVTDGVLHGGAVGPCLDEGLVTVVAGPPVNGKNLRITSARVGAGIATRSREAPSLWLRSWPDRRGRRIRISATASL